MTKDWRTGEHQDWLTTQTISLNAEDHAINMADILERTMQYYGGEVFLSDNGRKQLGDYFENVDYELRGATFELFVQELGERGVNYSVEMFQ